MSELPTPEEKPVPTMGSDLPTAEQLADEIRRLGENMMREKSGVPEFDNGIRYAMRNVNDWLRRRLKARIEKES